MKEKKLETSMSDARKIKIDHSLKGLFVANVSISFWSFRYKVVSPQVEINFRKIKSPFVINVGGFAPSVDG